MARKWKTFYGILTVTPQIGLVAGTQGTATGWTSNWTTRTQHLKYASKRSPGDIVIHCVSKLAENFEIKSEYKAPMNVSRFIFTYHHGAVDVFFIQTKYIISHKVISRASKNIQYRSSYWTINVKMAKYLINVSVPWVTCRFGPWSCKCIFKITVIITAFIHFSDIILPSNWFHGVDWC